MELPTAAPGPEDPRLEVEAALTADPCDVACNAMAAHVVGDLCAKDETWLQKHVQECSYCRDELQCYERMDHALAVCGELCCAVNVAPPPVSLPKRERVWYTRVSSPLGDLILAATKDGLREIDFGKNLTDAEFVTRLRESGAEPVRIERMSDVDVDVRLNLQRATAELEEYFGGHRDSFDIPLDWGAIPPFQRAVLEATVAVPFGHVDTYAGIAKRIGNPKATRAVGNALGRNPIPVIVPCHRVIRSDATLGGYTGGSGIKQHLLHLEGVTLA